MIHSIKFSQAVTWDGLPAQGILGVKFVNTTTAETATVDSVQIQTKETDLLQYVVTWVTDPVQGDAIEYDYDDALGVYYKFEGDPVDDKMASATLVITNCEDPTSNVGIVGAWTGDYWCGNPTGNITYNGELLKYNGEQLVHSGA